MLSCTLDDSVMLPKEWRVLETFTLSVTKPRLSRQAADKVSMIQPMVAPTWDVTMARLNRQDVGILIRGNKAR